MKLGVECTFCNDDSTRAALRDLKEWETGERRVFWRVRWEGIKSQFVSLGEARDGANALFKGEPYRVYRVTVRPKGAVK